MKILEKRISHKCFLLLWFIARKKLKRILKNYEIHPIQIKALPGLAPESQGLWIPGRYVSLTCISLVSEYGLISLSAHGGKEKT